MKTREDFKSFDEFYSSIANQKGVTEYISEVILSKYNINVLKKKFSKDEHFNNIPLDFWDNVIPYPTPQFIKKAFNEHGETSISLSMKVCLAKTVAKKLIKNDSSL